MNVEVTGGAGFIGANLCRELTSRPSGGKAVALDDLSTGTAANLAGTDTELVEGSILDRDVLDDVVARADAVVHLAARPSVPRSLADPLPENDGALRGRGEVPLCGPKCCRKPSSSPACSLFS